MAVETGPYDPWNAAVRSAAAAGGGWRAEVSPAQSGPRLIPGESEEKPQGQFARLVEGGRVTPPAPVSAPDAADLKDAADESWLTLDDFIDIINPFQHLPVIAPIYRGHSGDEISPAARIAGGGLFFGPFGAAGAAADALLEAVTGDDMGGHVMAFLDIGQDGGEDGGENGTQTAEAKPEAPPQARARAAEAAPEAAPERAPQNAPQLAALPADMLEALQGQNAVRPLDAGGFAFPQSAASASAAPEKPRAQAEAEAQDVRAAEARALRRSRAEAGAGPPPAGGVAGEGGWFSAVMLQALGRYETAQDLGRRAPQTGAAVNVEN